MMAATTERNSHKTHRRDSQQQQQQQQMELLALLQRYLVSSQLAVQWCAARIPQALEQHNMAAFLLLTYADLRVYTECKSDCTLVYTVAKM